MEVFGHQQVDGGAVGARGPDTRPRRCWRRDRSRRSCGLFREHAEQPPDVRRYRFPVASHQRVDAEVVEAALPVETKVFIDLVGAGRCRPHRVRGAGAVDAQAHVQRVIEEAIVRRAKLVQGRVAVESGVVAGRAGGPDALQRVPAARPGRGRPQQVDAAGGAGRGAAAGATGRTVRVRRRCAAGGDPEGDRQQPDSERPLSGKPGSLTRAISYA